MARPVSVYTPKKLADIKKAMEDYTEKTAIPILAEFSYNYGILREELYRHEELRYTIKDMMAKKEFQLEKMAMTNKINPTFAIFSLKQMGWKDKHELTHSIDDTVIDKLQAIYDSKK